MAEVSFKMGKQKPKLMWVDPKFAMDLKILSAKTNRSMIDLTRCIELKEPVVPKKKRSRWMDL